MNRFSGALRLSFILLAIVSLPAASAKDFTRHISSRTPVLGIGHELAADRSTPPNSPTVLANVKHNKWKKQAVLPGAVIHDISFSTLRTGYAAAELGQVWKTTDGGAHWTEIMNLGFPYYWFGVHALSSKDVVISGF